jgi:hypothetical protein
MKFIKQGHLKPNTLVQLLDHKLSGFTPARSHRKIHASSVTSEYKQFCPREYALMDILKKKAKDEYLQTATRVAFDIGEAYHDFVRDVWLVESAVGEWECKRCKHQIPFSKYPSYGCPSCGVKDWKYKEVNVVSPSTGISGSIDLIIDLGGPRYIPVEIKSIDKDQYKELAGPLSEHRIRTCLYLHLIEESEYPFKSKIETSFGLVLYISKGYGIKNPEEGKVLPFREFKVTKGVANVEPYLERARQVHVFRQKGGSLPQGVCDTNLCKRASDCSVKKECFSPAYGSSFVYEKDDQE